MTTTRVKAKTLSFNEGLKQGQTGPEVAGLKKFLNHYGYSTGEATGHIPQSLTVNSVRAMVAPVKEDVFDAATENAVREFQRFYALEDTGKIDKDTHQVMAAPRCGTPDRPLSFTLTGQKWDHTDITYRINNFSADLTPDETDNALKEAFQLWSAVSPLKFREAAEEEAVDINIMFAEGAHGDIGNDFDGIGQVLAHAYPPGRGHGLEGDVHFDEAERWSIELPPNGTDLVTVAAHEIGHALGLDHSEVRDSLMYAIYEGPHRELHEDDINGIRRLYGEQA